MENARRGSNCFAAISSRIFRGAFALQLPNRVLRLPDRSKDHKSSLSSAVAHLVQTEYSAIGQHIEPFRCIEQLAYRNHAAAFEQQDKKPD